MAIDDNRIVVPGRIRTIEWAVLASGDMPAKTFYNALDELDRNRLFALFVHIGNNGEFGITPGRFKQEERFPKDINNGNGRLWAFKDKTNRRPGGGKGMFRIGCFRIDDRWILLDGFWKPPQRMWPETDVTALMEIVREVLMLEKKRKKKGAE